MKAFIKDLFTDFEDHWDLKPIFGAFAFGFGFYYLGWLAHGDVLGFGAIEAIAAFLLGWAASPWGAGDPRAKKIGDLSINVKPTSEPPAKDGA
jgi:hypothetical protein